MRWVGWSIAAVVAVLVLAWGVGSSLPVAHTASVSRTVVGAPPDVWDAVVDVERHPEWRPGLETAGWMQDDTGRVWREEGPSGRMTLRVTTWEPPRRLVARIMDEGIPFGGQWTYEFAVAGPDSTLVTLTEDGEVYHPFFRFVSRFVLGHDRSMRAYLDALEARQSGTEPGR